MRFVDFLRTTVLISAAVATALAIVSILSIAGESRVTLAAVAVAWWIVAAVVGMRIGRGSSVNASIGRLLAAAKSTTSLPEIRPGALLINRLWPLFVFAVASAALGLLEPQIPGIAAGFAIIWSFSWRNQDGAVAAIEERDGVTFYIQRTSPLRGMSLLRAPGFRSSRGEQIRSAAG
jgi:hypothetical protein